MGHYGEKKKGRHLTEDETYKLWLTLEEIAGPELQIKGKSLVSLQQRIKSEYGILASITTLTRYMEGMGIEFIKTGATGRKDQALSSVERCIEKFTLRREYERKLKEGAKNLQGQEEKGKITPVTEPQSKELLRKILGLGSRMDHLEEETENNREDLEGMIKQHEAVLRKVCMMVWALAYDMGYREKDFAKTALDMGFDVGKTGNGFAQFTGQLRQSLTTKE